MKTVAVMSLQDGMQLAEDIMVGDKIAIKKGTKVDHIVKQKLTAFKLLTVNVLEAEDLAETYYEKLRVSEAYKDFKLKYTANLAAYKVAVDSFIYKMRLVYFTHSTFIIIDIHYYKSSITILSYKYGFSGF